jgi:hypothetical protein
MSGPNLERDRGNIRQYDLCSRPGHQNFMNKPNWKSPLLRPGYRVPVNGIDIDKVRSRVGIKSDKAGSMLKLIIHGTTLLQVRELFRIYQK